MDVGYLRLVLHEETDGFLTVRKRPQGMALDIPETRELQALLDILVERGIEKIRLTGDDPALRSDLGELLALAGQFEEVREIAMTTRGLGLAGRVGTLAKEGLHSINFSLDTLKPERYARMTGNDQFDAVWGAVSEALDYGLGVKLNVVLCRGTNDDEIPDFVDLAAAKPIQVRFTEWNADTDVVAPPSGFIPTWEVMAATRSRLRPVERGAQDGPARVFEVTGGRGEIGFIPNVTEHFCGDCNRIGLTDFGEILSCIFGHGQSLLGHLRSKEGEVAVSGVIDRVLRRKSLLAARLGGLHPVPAAASATATARPASP